MAVNLVVNGHFKSGIPVLASTEVLFLDKSKRGREGRSEWKETDQTEKD